MARIPNNKKTRGRVTFKSIVHIPDADDVKMNEMVDYCIDHNIQLDGYSNTDVSDSSLIYDMVAEFRFYSEEDALAFTLKFKT
jgi:hypothetical protein